MRRLTPGLPWLMLVLVALIPLLVEGTYYRYLGIIVFIYGIVAVGLNILAGYAGQFSLGHAAFMAMGAYTTALLTKALAPVPFFAATGLHIWLGVVLGTIVAAASGALLAFPALRVRGPYLAMVTIAFGWVIFKILQEWVSVTGGDLGLASIPKAQIGAWELGTGEYYYFVLAFFVLALILQRRIVQSPFGMRLRAMKQSEIGIASVGINVYRLKVTVFIVSAAFAGFGGALFAHQQNYVSPDNFQFFSSVFFLLAILFGGAGTLSGPVIGAAVLTLLPEFLHDFDKYRLIVYGSFILLTLYFLPRGIMGMFQRPPGRATNLGDAEGTGSTSPIAVASQGASLELRGVSRAFGGVTAVREATFKVRSGAVHAVIGPNGAGKTTIINLITGFYQPTSGKILLDGQLLKVRSLDAAVRLGVARTFQTIKLFGEMTVLEHVLVAVGSASQVGLGSTLFSGLHARPEQDPNRAVARGLIQFVGLRAYEDVPANTLAYGHRRLLEIARALAVNPKVLLLDEPAAGLVAEEISALGRVIERLKSSGMTIVLVEHHMDLVTTVSDRITVIDQGAVIAEGTPTEVQRDPRVIAAYLGPSHVAA